MRAIRSRSRPATCSATACPLLARTTSAESAPAFSPASISSRATSTPAVLVVKPWSDATKTSVDPARPEAVEGRQHLRDLAVGVPERLARGRRPDAQAVLRVVGLGDPVDHDGRGELRQHVLAQHPLGPRHRRVVALRPAALRRRGPELGEDRRAHVVRPCHALARIEVAVDEHPDPRRRPGVRQQGAARRARADRGQTEPARLEPLRQRASEDEAPARGTVDLEQAAVGGRIERARRIDVRDIDLVSRRSRASPAGSRWRAWPRSRG